MRNLGFHFINHLVRRLVCLGTDIDYIENVDSTGTSLRPQITRQFSIKKQSSCEFSDSLIVALGAAILRATSHMAHSKLSTDRSEGRFHPRIIKFEAVITK